MALMDQTVMDVLPWPEGTGYRHGHVVGIRHEQEERTRLDNLMGIALLDDEVCKRLVDDRDESAASVRHLGEDRAWLRGIRRVR